MDLAHTATSSSSHQGRLRHVARPLRRLRLAQVFAGQPRPEPGPHGLPYVDIFYHHRPDRKRRSRKPWARSIRRALRQSSVRGHFNYGPEDTVKARLFCAGRDAVPDPPVRLLDVPPRPEQGLLDTLRGERGRHCIFPLAQGLLSERYLGGGIPAIPAPRGPRLPQAKDVTSIASAKRAL